MEDLQIYIIGKGYLDLLDFTDFPLVLKKSIANISDVTARESDFSYDFEIPNNANNNSILFGMEYVSYADKSILGKQEAVIVLNGAEYQRGFVEVRASRFMDKYVCNFFGGNAEWIEEGANILVKDLDWKNDTQNFTQSGITAVNTSGRSINDIFYPFVDRNTANDIGTYRPVFYLRNLFELFFGHPDVGYSIDSDFLSSKFVNGSGDNKGLAVDLGVNFEFDESDIVDTIAQWRSTLNIDLGRLGRLIQSAGSAVTSEIIRFNLNSRYETKIDDAFDLFTTLGGYEAPKDGFYNFTFDFRGSNADFIEESVVGPGVSIFRYKPATGANFPLINLRILVNGIQKAFMPINSSTNPAGLKVDLGVYMLQGDLATFELVKDNIRLDNGAFQIFSMYRFVPNANTFNIQFKAKIELGDTYAISQVVPKEMKAIDLISDFKFLFNLYFDADIKRKVVKIESRNSWVDVDSADVDGYYQSVGLASNWTNLIDYTNPPEIFNELNYNRDLKLRYKADADDKWLLQWEKNNNRTYAQYIHNLGTRFPNGETVLETKIIAPTIQGRTSGVVSSIVRQEYAPLIGVDTDQPSPNNRYAPRIGWIVNSSIQVGPVIFEYSNFVMEAFDDLVVFSDSSKLTFNGTNGLFERFWSKNIRNLMNAVVVKCKVRLTKYEIKTFDFSKPVYIALPQQLAGYYAVQSIEVNLLDDDLVNVELLTYKDYAPLTVDPSQRTNINANTQNQQNQPARFVLFEDDTTGQLINVLDVDDNGNFINLIYE